MRSSKIIKYPTWFWKKWRQNSKNGQIWKAQRKHSFWLGVEQGLQKLPKIVINDLRLLFHCYILIPRKCPCKTPFKIQCPPPPTNPTALEAMPGLTSCQRKTIVRSSNPNNIMTKPWIFSLKLILFCSLKISVSQEEKERKEDSFRQFFNLFMALAAWKTRGHVRFLDLGIYSKNNCNLQVSFI